jgi:hypothetical protein
MAQSLTFQWPLAPRVSKTVKPNSKGLLTYEIEHNKLIRQQQKILDKAKRDYYFKQRTKKG